MTSLKCVLLLQQQCWVPTNDRNEHRVDKPQTISLDLHLTH